MLAVTERDTHTVTVMAGTQVLKTELLLNVAGYFIHQDPSAILFVQPSQDAAQDFSKERFAPTVEVTPVLRDLVRPPKARDSENTITHKDYPGGSLDFVGANSPTDLASRPRRIILCDEIDKYPLSAGSEGDPLKLAEERASTYRDVGRAKFVRTCSPTVRGVSRIGREYAASDQRQCFVVCPHCGHEQILRWAQVRWDKDANGQHMPDTAGIACDDCGVILTEIERRAMLDALTDTTDKGWRQTRRFTCCEVEQAPELWTDTGRALCKVCEAPAPYGGHAGFHASKLYSRRHRLSELVREFTEAHDDPESLRKFVNTALAELWERSGSERVDGAHLIDRGEPFGPDDVPNEVVVVTGFADVQGDRLEAQLIGWGADEEAWPLVYRVINLDPVQPAAWRELEALRTMELTRQDGRILRVAAFGVDTGGHHAAQVFSYCRKRRGQRVFPCKGVPGQKPIWPVNPTRSKYNEKLWLIGVDAAKDAVYARLKIEPGPPGEPQAGFIHFPDSSEFGRDYFNQLTVERRETKRRQGQTYSIWVCPEGKRNEALDTFVGCLAVRRSLPRRWQAALEYSPDAPPQDDAPAPRVMSYAAVTHAEATDRGDVEPGWERRPDGRLHMPRSGSRPRSGWLGGSNSGWLGGPRGGWLK